MRTSSGLIMAARGAAQGSPPFSIIAYALRPGDFRIAFCPWSFCVVKGALKVPFLHDFYISYITVIARLTRSKP